MDARRIGKSCYPRLLRQSPLQALRRQSQIGLLDLRHLPTTQEPDYETLKNVSRELEQFYQNDVAHFVAHRKQIEEQLAVLTERWTDKRYHMERHLQSIRDNDPNQRKGALMRDYILSIMAQYNAIASRTTEQNSDIPRHLVGFLQDIDCSILDGIGGFVSPPLLPVCMDDFLHHTKLDQSPEELEIHIERLGSQSTHHMQEAGYIIFSLCASLFVALFVCFLVVLVEESNELQPT